MKRGADIAETFPLPLDTEPMEARLADSLPEGDGWQYEPKWDGFRCLVFRAGDAVDLRAKSGKPLSRYFPEVVQAVAGWKQDRFVLDTELVIVADGRLAFDALQLRLHPAESRVRKLAAETPAELIAFDLLAAAGGPMLDRPLSERRKTLEKFVGKGQAALTLSPATRDRGDAEAWLEASGQGAIDGIVAKRLDGPYLPGERAMIKVKRLRTADCVVGGFRYGKNGDEVGALLLGLYDSAGKLDHVGFTATISKDDKPRLTRKLEALQAPPGFTGKAPGGPSRWSTERSGEWVPLKPELVVEVRYDQVTGNRFRHGTKLIRWRPDKAPRQCTFDQIAAPLAALPEKKGGL